MKLIRTEDLSIIQELNKEIFPLDKFYPEKNSFYWLLKYKKDIIGFCSGAKMDEDVFALTRSGVIKEFRGKNLQIRMIRARERLARKLKCTKVITYTKLDNICSSRNIQKAGYEIYIPVKEYADKDCIYWIKYL